jgi:hypothetical protein
MTIFILNVVVLFIFLCLEDFDLDTPHRMALGNHENGPVSAPVTPFSREGYGFRIEI